MKRLILTVLLAVFAINGFAWNKLGHAVAVAVAQRHLTDEAKINIAKYIDYDLKQDASWMDYHRKEAHLNYTDHWHSFCVDENFNHDPNASEQKLRYGDTMRALQVCESTLRNKRYEQIPDSLVIMSIRTLIHMVPDMHCPVHVRYNHKQNPRGRFEVNGKVYKGFHILYDSMPSIIWDTTPADEVAARIDNASRREIRKIVSGDIHDWVYDIAKMNVVIFDIDHTESHDLVNTQLRNAGYRLAYLLNLYFGE
jgi:hypothetical protein